MGFFDKLFGSDASFLGFMDFAGELDNEKPDDEVELTFTIEVDDDNVAEDDEEDEDDDEFDEEDEEDDEFDEEDEEDDEDDEY